MEASQGGDCILEEFPTKRPKTLAVSSLDLVLWRRASQGECFDVQFDRPSRRVDEAVRVVVGARDSLNGLRGVRVGEASNPGRRNLFLRRSRAVRASPIESTAVDPTTMVRQILTTLRVLPVLDSCACMRKTWRQVQEVSHLVGHSIG